MTRFRCSQLTIWLLVCSGLAMGCEWDPSGDTGLVPGPGSAASGLEKCKDECCATAGCDMIVFDLQAGQCEVVTDCRLKDPGLCDRQSSQQVTVLRRKTEDQGQGNSATKTLTDGTGTDTDNDSNDCEAEADVGPCRAMILRWYYDKDSQSCKKFVYGGCRGNKNNYDSETSCTAACTVTVPSESKKVVIDDMSEEYKGMCMVTPDPGPCRAAFTMFYYDPNTDSCQTFTYGGCHGNKNRYTSLEECYNTCTAEGRGEVRNHWSPAVFLFITLAAVSGLLLVTLLITSLRRRVQFRRHSSVSDKEELLPSSDEKSSLNSLTLPESPNPGKP